MADGMRNRVNRMPPLPERVQVTGYSTDPGLTVQLEENGSLVLSGLATGSEETDTQLWLAFDGARVSVGLCEKMTPQHVLRLLERVMPEGYRVAMLRAADDEVALELVRRPRTLTPSQEKAKPERAATPAVTNSLGQDALAG